MWIINFLQTREGQHAIAIGTVLLICLALYLNIHPFKKSNHKHVPSAQWDLSSYCMYVNAMIASSLNIKQLHEMKFWIDDVHKKTFNPIVTQKERIKYHTRLSRAFNQKENELMGEVQLYTT